MQYQKHRTLVIICLLIFSASFAFSQGLYWESVTTVSMAGEHKMNSKSFYRPHMFKQMSDEEATIFRLDKDVLYNIDYHQKEYSEMTFAELEALVKQANGELEGQMAELKKHLANVPAEQREAMEQMMGNKIKGGSEDKKIEVIKTSESKSINGYSCTKYIFKEDGKEMGSIWTTTNVPDFSSMQKDFKEFSQRLASQMSMKGFQMAEAMKKIDGFPIQTTIRGVTAMVTKLEKRSIAMSEFEVPASFKKVKSENMMDKRHKGQQKPSTDEEKEEKD
jgi:GLPGLI family protein